MLFIHPRMFLSVDVRIVILFNLSEVWKLKSFTLLKQQHLFLLCCQSLSILALAPFPTNVESWEEALGV